MGRDRDDPRVGSDELIEVGRIATRDVAGRVMTEEGGFEHADAGGHVARRAVVGVLEIPPFRVLTVENSLQPDGQRRHAHLDEVASVIDRFGQGRCQDDQGAVRHAAADDIRPGRLAVIGHSGIGLLQEAAL